MSPDPFSRISIAEERIRRHNTSDDDLVRMISSGNESGAVENLIYFASPTGFVGRVEKLIQRIGETANADRVLSFLTSLTIALRSFLPKWNLANRALHGNKVLLPDRIEALARTTRQFVLEFARNEPEAATALLEAALSYATARYRAEEAADADERAAVLVDGSVGEYIDKRVAEISSSNLRRIAEMRNDSEMPTEIGNDFAAFLDHTLYLGASFCTTNPPLVDMAWTAQPDKWDPVVDQIIAENRAASDDDLARLVTLEVVLENMRLLRPIFLLSDGHKGRVCLQVNPKNHGNPDAMIRDALFFHQDLSSRLDGGVPNVLFKIPGTKAGLEAARALTARGIGVTITVNFGMFQHLPFAQAIADGSAVYSCLVVMNGRLAFPVRDELLAKLDTLNATGIDAAQAREAAAWAGIAVAKKLHGVLKAGGFDNRKIRSLVASLRIYRGDGYDDLPSAFPDVTEILGADIVSVFPNVREPFDAERPFPLRPHSIEEPVPPWVLQVLSHSEIFRQAYHISKGLGQSKEDEDFCPARELVLDNVEEVADWPPNKQTLDQFCAAHDGLVRRIREHEKRATRILNESGMAEA